MSSRQNNEPPKYYMFIDESGDASVNNLGQYFLLGTVIVDQDDFQLIKGYMRLLKRNFFGDDYRNLHATDIFERPSIDYSELLAPVDKTASFIAQLAGVLRTIPYQACIYRVDKNKIRKKYNYKPAKGRKPPFNGDIAYELASTEAIIDFAKFLKTKKCSGEITIESRMHKDAKFVGYFDDARKPFFPGGRKNPDYKIVSKHIPSLFISNKDASNVGLELADIASYVSYRKQYGDPQNKLILEPRHINPLYAAINRNAYKGAPVSLIHDIGV